MSDIYATAMREAAKSPEQRKAEAEERAACSNQADNIAVVLDSCCEFHGRAEYVGGNVLKIVADGREYRVIVTWGVKRG